MSVLDMVRQWGGMAGLIGLVWFGVEAIRHRSKALRLDRETYEKRPLVPDEKLAVLRPGDTVLMMPPLDGLTVDQQEVLVGSMKAMIERVKARGIEFIVIPDWGQKAIVVSRGTLDEDREKVGADGTASLELIDLSSNHSHIAIVRSYDAATHTCMVEVPWRTRLIEADIDYPQKSDPMILKAGMNVYVRFFPAIEGYVVPD